jgi:hypothetical protein
MNLTMASSYNSSSSSLLWPLPLVQAMALALVLGWFVHAVQKSTRWISSLSNIQIKTLQSKFICILNMQVSSFSNMEMVCLDSQWRSSQFLVYFCSMRSQQIGHHEKFPQEEVQTALLYFMEKIIWCFTYLHRNPSLQQGQSNRMTIYFLEHNSHKLSSLLLLIKCSSCTLIATLFQWIISFYLTGFQLMKCYCILDILLFSNILPPSNIFLH